MRHYTTCAPIARSIERLCVDLVLPHDGLITDGGLLNWRHLLLLEPGDTDREQIAIAALIVDVFTHTQAAMRTGAAQASEVDDAVRARVKMFRVISRAADAIFARGVSQ